MPFQSGQSGNPAGRPSGSRNKSAVVVDHLLDDSADAVTRAAITRATDGDPAALRACMDRLAPRARHRPIDFPLPPLVTLADTPPVLAAIVQGLAQGELDIDQAAALTRGVREFTLALAALERDKRPAAPVAPAAANDPSRGQSLADFMASRLPR